MSRFLSPLGAMLYISISMFIAIALVAVGLGTFAGIALHGQEIYAWVMQQPGLGLLAGQVAAISKLKIDPAGLSSDARLINDGILGMIAVFSAAFSIALCLCMLRRALSMLAGGFVAFRNWRRSRSL